MLDNRQSQNVLDSRQSRKVYRENHEKLESGIDYKRKKFSWGENPKRYTPGRCAINITICNSYDATQSRT